MKSTEEWYEIGFSDGVEAGTTPLVPRGRDFGPHEDILALGHRILNGRYNVIRRRQIDFHSFEAGASWMTGVQAGIASVDACIGYQIGVSDPSDGPNGGMLIYVLVTDRPTPTGAAVN